jgi:hypothetical protein
MKPWEKVSSFRDANSLFQGQQNKGRSDREERSWKNRSNKRAEERPETRSKEIQGPELRN